jgi:dipeptidyl aminopeptidase/acylaminoacyl peptidase
MLKRLWLFVFVALLATPCYPADVVFGRRVYAAAGRSYEQLWTLDTASRQVVPLSRTPRRHAAPACSPDGRRIWFLSGAFGDETNTELWWFDPRTHGEALAVRFGVSIFGIDSLLGGDEGRAFFTGYEGHALGLYRWDGHLTKLASADRAALAPDARSLAVEMQTGSVTMMEPGGARGRTLEKCSGPLWSPDGRRLACVAGQTVRVLNLTTGVETAHAEFAQRPTAPFVADFAPDGAHLMVGTLGANHTSTFPQLDFWVLEIATGKWTFVGPGQSAIFAPCGSVLLVPPRELQPKGKVHEWMSQLLLVDPATHAQAPVAAGMASDVEPCRCVVAAPASGVPQRSASRRPDGGPKPAPAR